MLKVRYKKGYGDSAEEAFEQFQYLPSANTLFRIQDQASRKLVEHLEQACRTDLFIWLYLTSRSPQIRVFL